MPIHMSPADKARELIRLYEAAPKTRTWAEDARRFAEHAATEGLPPEIVAAYRILAEEAETEAAETAKEYETARAEFAEYIGMR